MCFLSSCVVCRLTFFRIEIMRDEGDEEPMVSEGDHDGDSPRPPVDDASATGKDSDATPAGTGPARVTKISEAEPSPSST
jgi:hypothetical protein